MKIEVDSIIFEDGTLIGPDFTGRLEKVNSQIRADKELIESIGSLQTDELQSTLQLYSTLGASDPYSFQRLRRVRMILKIFEIDGEQEARTVINEIGSQVRFANSAEKIRRLEQ